MPAWYLSLIISLLAFYRDRPSAQKEKMSGVSESEQIRRRLLASKNAFSDKILMESVIVREFRMESCEEVQALT